MSGPFASACYQLAMPTLNTFTKVDFVVWDDQATLLLEVKAAQAIHPEDAEQCLLYLRNGNFRLCLLANFGEVPLGKKRFAPFAYLPLFVTQPPYATQIGDSTGSS
jgi:hypothetical protein